MRGLQDDAAEAEWFPVTGLPQPLAFDHKEVVRTAFAKLLDQPQALETGARRSLTVLGLAKVYGFICPRHYRPMRVSALSACSDVRAGLRCMHGLARGEI